LRGGQPKTWHLEVLTLDPLEHFIYTHRDTPCETVLLCP